MDVKVYTILLLLLLFFFASFIRIYNISTTPPGLYVDEVSVAYNAYTILKTGKDEHGKKLPFAFQAYGEYKMPVFIYLTSLSMALFGKNEFAIRIPSAFFGSLTVLLFYFFSKEIIQYEKKLKETYQELFAFLSTFLLAISPWHLQFSRAGFEAIVALFFYLFGLLFFLYFYREKKNLFLYISFLSLGITIYTYNAFRIISPLSLVCLFAFILLRMPKQRKIAMKVSLVTLVCMCPMILFSLTQAGLARFRQVTAFTWTEPNGFFFYPIQYLNNYLAHFSLSFLFSYGDGIGRHTVFRMGPLFKWESIPLLVGLFWLVKEKATVFTYVLLFLFLVSPVAAALALPSPHLLRSLPLIFPITLVISYGIIRILLIQNWKKYLLCGFLLFIACFEYVLYSDLYYNHANVSLADWGNQYKELIQKIAIHKDSNTRIFINMNVGMNSEYVKFYDQNMQYTLVDQTWKKPAVLGQEDVLYITTPDRKTDLYLETIPHTLLDSVTTPDAYHNVLYNIWKL